MEERGLSLAELQEVPEQSLVLLAGPPGAGKSSFCHQVVLNGLAMDKPVIFVATEQRSPQVISLLRERGLGESTPKAVSFVDAYSQTVGVETPDRPDTVYANCMDLNSISIATTKLQERMGRRGILLAFDSLTSPYLLSGAEVTRFMRLFLSKFAAEGNSVLALMDEGCGKEEDLVAMMSVADGVIKVQREEDRQLLDVVKHPRMEPTRIEVPMRVSTPPVIAYHFDADYLRREAEILVRGPEATLRPELGDFINIAWRSLVFWSGTLWDPRRFPTMMYESTKYSEDPSNLISLLPWRVKLLLRFMPKSFSKVKNMRKYMKTLVGPPPEGHGMAVFEYLDDISKTDEHYLSLHEGYECWGLENVGSSVGLMRYAMIAGILKGLENLKGLERDWNVVETKCLGLGDPYCEVKLVPGEIPELKDSLEKDSAVVERIHERLMDHLMGFLVQGNPLMERPALGSDVHIHEVQHVMCVPLVSERLQMVFRMGGARAGKMVAERLLESGLTEEEAITRVVDLMEHCKVGRIRLGDTIRMKENCERFGIRTEQPSCFFTTGFLNGLFSAVKNQHVREIKCIAAGDPYCEWEII